jgi:inner membrane transporter RhtA
VKDDYDGGPGASHTRVAAALAVGSIVSVQCGSALATTLFDSVGPSGAVALRSAFGALALLALARGRLPRLRGVGRRDVVLFGVALAGVNLLFYAALDRLPLGIAVTLEFVGPLGVAVFGSRRRRDLIWALLAAIGIVLLSDGGGGGVDPLGVALASISAVLVAVPGIAQGGAELLAPANLAVGLAVGVLSSAIPCAFEMEALRRLPRAVFGVLMSLEPAVAAAIGFVALSQDLAPGELAAIALVVVACAGALRSAATPPPRDG